MEKQLKVGFFFYAAVLLCEHAAHYRRALFEIYRHRIASPVFIAFALPSHGLVKILQHIIMSCHLYPSCVHSEPC